MENRFNHNSPEEQRGWGGFASSSSADANPIPQRPLLPQAQLCARVREMLPHLLESDGEIRPEMAAHVYSHLSVCPDCAREFDEMQQIVKVLEAVPPAELPMDFSGIIMHRLYQEQMAAVPSVAPLAAEVERTATRQETMATTAQTTQETTTETQSTLRERITVLGIFTALLTMLLSTGWGQRLLGSQTATALNWMEHLAQEVRRIPVLSWVLVSAFAALSQAGHLLSQSYHALGSHTMQALTLEIILGAMACIFLGMHQQRTQRLRI